MVTDVRLGKSFWSKQSYVPFQSSLSNCNLVSQRLSCKNLRNTKKYWEILRNTPNRANKAWVSIKYRIAGFPQEENLAAKNWNTKKNWEIQSLSVLHSIDFIQVHFFLLQKYCESHQIEQTKPLVYPSAEISQDSAAKIQIGKRRKRKKHKFHVLCFIEKYWETHQVEQTKP